MLGVPGVRLASVSWSGFVGNKMSKNEVEKPLCL